MDVFLFIDDLEPNSLAVIPGMGIPEQLKLAMEQEQMGKSCTYKFYFCRSVSYLHEIKLFWKRQNDLCWEMLIWVM